MNGEGDSVSLRDTHPAFGQRAQELLGACLEGIDRAAHASDSRNVDCILEHEEAALVERSCLLVTDQPKRPAHRRPNESMIQRMQRSGGISC